MTPSPIKATFIRSRSQLLDTALKHLSEAYYPRLSEDKDRSCAYKKIFQYQRTVKYLKVASPSHKPRDMY